MNIEGQHAAASQSTSSASLDNKGKGQAKHLPGLELHVQRAPGWTSMGQMLSQQATRQHMVSAHDQKKLEDRQGKNR